MPKTTLQLINSTLALIGEQSLTSSVGKLGQLTRDALNTSILTVVQESRANVFESTITVNVTNNDYLVPATVLLPTVLQVYSVALRISTGSIYGDKLIRIEYLPLESIDCEPSYSIIGSNVYVSPSIARPHTLFIQTLQSFTLAGSDAADCGLPDAVIPAVQHTAAAILGLSYLDDPNQANTQQNLSEQLLEKLRKQYGAPRAKNFNMSGQRNSGVFSGGGISSINASMAYAPLADAALTGSPTLNGSPLQTTLTLTTALAPYLLQSSASSTYLTISNATSTYLTQANATATYLTQVNAATAYVSRASIAPKVRARRTTDQMLTNNVEAIVVFNLEDSDAASAFNSSSGVFTVPAGANGEYEIAVNVSLLCTSSTSDISFGLVFVYKNGSKIAALSQTLAGNTTTWTHTSSGFIKLTLAVADTIDIRVLAVHNGTSPVVKIDGASINHLAITKQP